MHTQLCRILLMLALAHCILAYGANFAYEGKEDNLAYDAKDEKGAYAYYCLQCNSAEDELCGPGLVEPTKCHTKVVGCMTYVGRMPAPGPDVVIRSCAQMDLGSTCENIGGKSADGFQHSVCLYTCYDHRCNNQPFTPFQFPGWR